jgi:hypothetical protein
VINIRAPLIALAIMWTPLALAGDSARVSMSGGWAGLGVGVNWGHGVLAHEGHEYPFSITGISIGDFGGAAVTASGTAHNLNRAEDFNGRYTGAKSRVTVVAEGSAVTTRNEHGVTSDLVIATAGLKLAFRLGGIRVEIPPSALTAVRAEVAAAHAADAARRLDAAATRVEIAAQRAECIADRSGRTPTRRMRGPRVGRKA